MTKLEKIKKREQEVLGGLLDIPIEDLIELKNVFDGYFERKMTEALKEVKSEKIPGGGVNYEYNEHRFQAKYEGKYLKVYKRIPGVKQGTFKKGSKLISNYYGNYYDLKRNIRFNKYMDSNLY